MNKAATLAALAALATGGFMAGCDLGDDGATIEIEPSETTLSATNHTVTLTARVDADSALLPLTWSVTDSALGTLTRNSGTSVVYEATAELGVNTVIARAGDGSAGTALITQRATANTGPLRVTPTQAVLSGADRTVIFTATITDSGDTSRLLPLQWEESNASLGSITAVSGLTATYTRAEGAVGRNTIVAHAADGSQFAVEVVQQ